MQTRMNIQDELDKETLSLIGVKDSKDIKGVQMPLGGVANLDASCLTCGQLNVTERNHIYASFKMACLQYRPSGIQLDSNLNVSRRECAELQASKIQRLVELRENTGKHLDLSKKHIIQLEEDIKTTQE